MKGKLAKWLGVVLLVLAAVAISIVVRLKMPLGETLSLGQSQVVAVRNLEKGQPLMASDLDTVQAPRRTDVFTDTANLVNAYTSAAITKHQPILHSQVHRYQVVTKAGLKREHKITADDVALALTPYREGALTDTTDAVELSARQPISKGMIILPSLVATPTVMAKKRLEMGRQIAEGDVELVFLDQDAKKGEFVDMAQVVGLVTSKEIDAREPITKGQVTSMQVVASGELEAGHVLTSTDVTLAWKPYDEDAFASPDAVEGLKLRRGAAAGEAITMDMVYLLQVSAATHLKAGHLISEHDLARIWWDVSDKAFREKGDVVDSTKGIYHYTLVPVEVNDAILGNQVQRCQAIAARAIGAGQQIVANDLKVQTACKSVDGEITPPLVGRFTWEAIANDKAVEESTLVPADLLENKSVVSFRVPASASLGGNLRAGNKVDIHLVPRPEDSSAQGGLSLSQCLLLTVKEIAPAQGADEEGKESPPLEPQTLIVAAIPSEKEAEFVRRLPTSDVVLTLGTK